MTTAAFTRTILSERVVSNRRFAILQFQPATGSLTTWSAPALAELAEALWSLDTSRVDAVVFHGTGRVFGAGADLDEFRTSARWEDGAAIATRGYDIFDAISRLDAPTVAVIQGPALGGALELALRTDYRVAASSVRALGLPEVSLGLIPGWGGLTSMARLIGPARTRQIAVAQSLNGNHLTAAGALEEGIVDVVLEDEDLLEAALRWTNDLLDGVRSVRNPAADTGAGTAVERSQDTTPAAAAVSDLLARWQQHDRPAASSASRPCDRTSLRLAAGKDPIREDTIKTFATLLQSNESRASIYAFYILQEARKNNRTSMDLELGNVGVIGGGLMAVQLALVFAEHSTAQVLINDLDQARVNRALEQVTAQLDRSVRRGRLTAERRDEIRRRIHGTVRLEDFYPCEIVIEAVFEQLEVKRQVWDALEQIVAPDTLLLTNTSALSIDDQATALQHPGRLIGFHFFNPVAVLSLIEIVQGVNTSSSTVEKAFVLARALGKTPILVQDCPGFVVNRLLTRLFSEVLQLIDDGSDPFTVDHALDPVGLPMTPLRLLQFIGPRVQLHICESLYNAYPDRFPPSASLARVAQAGLPGYLADDGGILPEAAVLLPPAKPAATDEIRARILSAMADEAEHMLREGVVIGPEQIDLCMILGANYPLHTGGLTPLLDRETGSSFRPDLHAGVPTRG
ncbi:3-hydroxyacyl-CoA dehydrogenase NAD-binding domain-containing protein [Pseudarthrobacter sp. HLT3-5]|uniref:3-hydroxyacyl-CoA dehydrogenase NAD-binding domain-containing protein n=1 Tax=Pseudarthrobacter cellobiosi TaxID=2953654 RepID=UPI00208F11AC|nr:3-hydroxyacyl-CoA dehydrogenase NAD-binding domain-containing protein [Pseudarthrobacter sp. HLT3-5]MCO4273815.1 3-hydroxyacyl-CoA dehydrogenase NAD-binding domain-containing protein [Pseudarthrobacter sp. HLT3-5]